MVPAIKRVAMDQLCFAPVGLAAFFTYMTLAEGGGKKGILRKLDHVYIPALYVTPPDFFCSVAPAKKTNGRMVGNQTTSSGQRFKCSTFGSSLYSSSCRLHQLGVSLGELICL